MKLKFNGALFMAVVFMLLLTCSRSGSFCYAADHSDGNVLIGYDGCGYNLSGYYDGYCYNEIGWLIGNIKNQELGEAQAYHFFNDNGHVKLSYCLEHRVSTGGSFEYSATNINQSKYMKYYPYNQRQGMLAIALYAPRYVNETSPVAGTNTDDWYWASRVLIWEFQEGIRRSVSDGINARKTGRFVDKSGAIFSGSDRNHYYNSLFYGNNVGGTPKPALACYRWMVNSINSQGSIPSFASGSSSNVKTFILDSNYQVVLTDANKLNVDFFTKDNNVTVSRTGNRYTFTSSSPLENGLTIVGYKVPDNTNEILNVWDSIGAHRQTMMTGTILAAPMYIRLRGERPKGNLLVHKTAEDGVVGNIRFKVTYDADGSVEYIVTDGQGNARLDNILCGTYTVSECDVPIKYVKPADVNIIIEDNATKEITFFNQLKVTSLKIIKTDYYTGSPLANTEFKVFDAETNQQVIILNSSGEEVACVTDSNGEVVIENTLKADREYLVREVAAPEGYKLDEIGGVSFTPTGENSLDELGFKNKPYLGFKLTKTTEKGTNLQGAEYTIYSKEDMNKLYTKVTDNKGEIYVKDLEPGDYVILETKAPKGYLLNDVPEHFIINGEKPHIYEIRVVDGEYRAFVNVKKVDSENKEGLGGTEFRIFAKENIYNADGLVYKKDCLIEELITDGKGEALSIGLPLGKYYLTETKAKKGYIKTDEIFDFEVTEKKQVNLIIENDRAKAPEPKTGDDTNCLIHLIVAMLALSGALMGIRFID